MGGVVRIIKYLSVNVQFEGIVPLINDLMTMKEFLALQADNSC